MRIQNIIQNIRYSLVALTTVVAAVVFGVTFVHAVWYAPETQVPPQSTSAVHTNVASNDYPVRLRIPALGIDAVVEQVGLTAAGRMAAPSRFSDVAWYTYGPLPGQMGNAVIDGHVDNGLGLAGVFKHLSSIKEGDVVQVQTKKGSTLSFIVDEIHSYPYTDVPTKTIFTTKGDARLTLITCEGTWVAEQKTYDKRLVVGATLK